MKVKFMSDFNKHKEGDVVEVAEVEAEELHQAGIAYPYTEPEPEKKKTVRRTASKSK